MTDNSNFVLRWEINNATAIHAAGNKVESGVYNEGGYKWTAAIAPNEAISSFHPSRIGVTLQCGVDHDLPWNCVADVAWYLLKANGTKSKGAEERLYYPEHCTFGKQSCFYYWDFLISKVFNINDKFTLEFHIRIINSQSHAIIELNKFCSPSEKCNVSLVFGDKKLLVSKEYLAIHSPVFAAMFYGNFAENGKEEVEIKDVVYKEFIDLMFMIFPDLTEMNDVTVLHILKLADRFQMKHVVNMSEQYIMKSKGFKEIEKILLSDQYRLVTLRAQCLSSISKAQYLKKSLEFANFSDEMKTAICDRIKGIKNM